MLATGSKKGTRRSEVATGWIAAVTAAATVLAAGAALLFDKLGTADTAATAAAAGTTATGAWVFT
jgi:hypothetical protein